MKRMTIRDLAKMLQLSPSTVSRALSDHPDISDATKARVKEVAEAFNYSINLHSSLFRNKRSNLIALIIPDINMFYVPSMVNAINDFLYTTQFSLFVFISNDKIKREKELVSQCIKWAVEGILISPSSETKSLEHLEALDHAGIKTVVLDKILKPSKYPSVSINNTNASFLAVDYLISKKHLHILGVFGNPNMEITKERIKGFEEAHRANDIQYENENIVTTTNISELDSILPLVIRHKKEITAIFCMSDETLARVNFHLMSSGKRIYDDISLIAISDGFYPHLTFPKATYVRDSGRKMGKKACELLIEQIDGGDSGPKHLELKTRLVELHSVRTLG